MATWTYELTHAELPRLQQSLEWCLQNENQRIAAAIPTQKLSIEARRGILIACGLVMIAIGGWLAVTYRFDSLSAIGLVGGAVVVLAALALRRIRSGGRRLAGRMIAFRAARMFAGFRRATPGAITYKLDDGGLDVQSAKVPNRGRMQLAWARRMYHCGDIIYTVPHPGRLPRILFVPASEQPALFAAFAACRTEVIAVAGPTEGYGDPLPPARAIG